MAFVGAWTPSDLAATHDPYLGEEAQELYLWASKTAHPVGELLALWDVPSSDQSATSVKLTINRYITTCAVKRRWTSAGASPARELVRIHPVAIETMAEATKLSELSMERVARRLREHAGRNVSKR